jgi:hypothetical protein
LTYAEDILDYLLAAGPLVTSVAVAYVAWAQYRMNRRKFRFDLYNRRFAVFEAALSYYQAYYSKDSEALDRASVDFVRGYREASFLFGRDSSVYHALTTIKDALAAGPANREEPTAAMQELENALLPWLDFRKFKS